MVLSYPDGGGGGGGGGGGSRVLLDGILEACIYIYIYAQRQSGGLWWYTEHGRSSSVCMINITGGIDRF